MPDSVRRPPGTEDAVELKADDETLADFLRLRNEFGNVVSMKSSRGRDVYFVNEPAAIQRVLVRDHDKYVKGPGFERVKLLLGNGIFVSDGSHWRRARRMAQPGFTRRKLRGLINLIKDRVEARAFEWERLAESGEAIDITTEMSDFALELILRAIFGADYDEQIVTDGQNPFAFLAEEFSRDINLVVKFRALRQFILEIINARRQREPSAEFDFLSVYMSAVDKSGQSFTDRELLDEVMTLIIAGFETSAGTLNWSWYLIAKHPDAAAKIMAEVERVFADDAELTSERLNELVYLEQIINETMRLYPPGWVFSRRALVDTDIGDFDVPKGTDLFFSPYILHRTSEFWPQPNTFDPDRFSTDRFDAAQEAAFIPFSLGPRRCIGEYFAMLEMKINLAVLVPRFDMSTLADDEPPLDLGINLRSKGSIFLNARSRATS
ncbi:MAG: cytochrome P450 [Pseudomonadota bacterium]